MYKRQDDGSTDGSLRIAQKYGADYANIRVFTHLNSGAAETRNEAKMCIRDRYWTLRGAVPFLNIC